MPKRKMSEEEKIKRFRPLQKHEDRQRATWYLIGALPILVIWLYSLIN